MQALDKDETDLLKVCIEASFRQPQQHAEKEGPVPKHTVQLFITSHLCINSVRSYKGIEIFTNLKLRRDYSTYPSLRLPICLLSQG